MRKSDKVSQESYPVWVEKGISFYYVCVMDGATVVRCRTTQVDAMRLQVLLGREAREV